eukprot:TRINITY_DN10535_c1_g1_i3.p1 TRINITY_DN10535_c1_g1~~TRINITY_DN10535_c1_g1_i3.p1  ORF type:complete len:751 (-),score=247.92 TRINITY_DN10535_c1_g1_i3:105-2102(-)
MVADSDRVAIKTGLPRGLSDPENKIRTAVAMAIATIAHWDWPEQWPTLVQDLVTCLQSPDKNLLKGAIKCLDIFASGDNLSDEYLAPLLNLLVPELYKVFQDGNQTERIKSRAVSIFYSLVRWMAITKEHKKDLKFFFQQILPPWLTAFVPALSATETSLNDCGLKLVIMKVLIVLVGDFAKDMKPHLPNLMAPVWGLIVQGLPTYEKVAINDSLLSAAQDSEGESLGFEQLVEFLLEFVRCIVEKPSLASLVKGHVSQMIYFCIKYMQMTNDDEEMWESDPNEFVAGEDDEFRYSVRQSSLDLIEMMTSVKDVKMDVLVQVINQCFEESNQARQKGAKNWWKIREATVWVIGTMCEQLVEDSTFNVAAFINTILREDVTTQGIPFLKGRALWCASKFSGDIDPQVITPFLQIATASLQNASDPIPVKIGACRALQMFCPGVAPEIVQPLLPELIVGTVNLLQSATEGTLHLVLETLLFILKVNPQAIVQFEELISSHIMSVWSGNVTDCLITTIVTEILEVIVSVPECYPKVVDRLLQPIITILKAPKEMPGITEAGIDLLRVLLDGPTVPSEALLTGTLPHLFNMMNTTEDTQIMETAAFCLSAVVRKAHTVLPTWRPFGNATAAEIIVTIAARLLDPNHNDIFAICGAPLITIIVSKVGIRN